MRLREYAAGQGLVVSICLWLYTFPPRHLAADYAEDMLHEDDRRRIRTANLLHVAHIPRYFSMSDSDRSRRDVQRTTQNMCEMPCYAHPSSKMPFASQSVPWTIQRPFEIPSAQRQ